MNNTFAFIVGIAKYDQPDWNEEAAANNAVAIANWCVDSGIFDPQNVVVFIDSTKQKAGVLLDKGVEVNYSAKKEPLDDFIRERLALTRPANSRLLVYWSGHGYIDKDRAQILICRDYTKDRLVNRVFNAKALRNYLQSEDFRYFTDQLFLADVCQTYTKLDFWLIAFPLKNNSRKTLNKLRTLPVPKGNPRTVTITLGFLPR